MKRKTKFALGGISLLFGALVLSGCTQSFCSITDKAHILYAFDYGITDYVDGSTTETSTDQAYAYFGTEKVLLNNVKYRTYSTEEATAREEIYKFNKTYKNIDNTATKNGIRLPSVTYLHTLDAVVLGKALKADGYTTTTAADIQLKDVSGYYCGTDDKGALDRFGYLKFDDSTDAKKKVLWTNYSEVIKTVKEIIGADECPSNDYLTLHKTTLNSSISAYRSCLAIETGDYGSYGPRGVPVEIEGKKWTDWRGLLEFILVWPIGAFIDLLTSSFLAGGIVAGWAQMLSILIVTVIVRSLMLIFTIRQSASTAKINELQPEIQKIQAKYPNANQDQNQKQRMAADMQKLYKKNKINPLSSILVMIVQFPIFICVWGAMQGSAYLSSGQFFGLRFSDSISSALFNASNWATGTAETALILFLLMSAAQAVAMLLPQWIQKKKAKDVAKLGRNPAQKSQTDRMKWFTYIMLAMIIFMGFSLASGMGIYWFFGALFSLAQTLIMQKITDAKAKRAKYGKK